jgi:hypothetical protein
MKNQESQEKEASRIHEEILSFLQNYRNLHGIYDYGLISWALTDLLLNHFIDMKVKKEEMMNIISDHYDNKIADMKEKEIISKEYT